ncbi:transposase [Paenibacillus hexagrammi]|uniref:Transposase n=1 Tax=Paenibacillus hexagrammi TaxID=2908839 RepID=A0ABY3SG03_9BACL|nr:transposase [Paenibacillus sp. YPD9-1]UJF32116.1 transposase [Paenibacillus sp. YPD9-1]
MIFLLIIAVLIAPLFMLITSWMIDWCAVFYNVIAILCAYTVGIIVSYWIYVILRDNQVFMTTIHGIFQNQAFLASGAYLGGYAIYLLLRMTFKHIRADS